MLDIQETPQALRAYQSLLLTPFARKRRPDDTRGTRGKTH